MKKLTSLLLTVLLILCGCSKQEESSPTEIPPEMTMVPQAEYYDGKEDYDMSGVLLKIDIGEISITALLARNPAAQALRQHLEDGSVTISASNYGGWEKVAQLPWALPASDTQITAQAGDIMLYNGDSIVLFYGSNSWAYTRLGTILTNTADSLEEALSGPETEIRLSLFWE